MSPLESGLYYIHIADESDYDTRVIGTFHSYANIGKYGNNLVLKQEPMQNFHPRQVIPSSFLSDYFQLTRYYKEEPMIWDTVRRNVGPNTPLILSANKDSTWKATNVGGNKYQLRPPNIGFGTDHCVDRDEQDIAVKSFSIQYSVGRPEWVFQRTDAYNVISVPSGIYHIYFDDSNNANDSGKSELDTTSHRYVSIGAHDNDLVLRNRTLKNNPQMWKVEHKGDLEVTISAYPSEGNTHKIWDRLSSMKLSVMPVILNTNTDAIWIVVAYHIGDSYMFVFITPLRDSTDLTNALFSIKGLGNTKDVEYCIGLDDLTLSLREFSTIHPVRPKWYFQPVKEKVEIGPAMYFTGTGRG
ncbi:hypothetical protein BDQ17DRAFT_1438369 [Cyathus striatus]|nr:hypothetical protein BDQ17DRAFT_1438369 [Cyathus striatus]